MYQLLDPPWPLCKERSPGGSFSINCISYMLFPASPGAYSKYLHRRCIMLVKFTHTKFFHTGTFHLWDKLRGREQDFRVIFHNSATFM